MKKVFVVLCCVFIAALLSVSAFAEMIPSATGKLAPWVLDVKDVEGNPLPTGELIVTPYSERETLPANLKNLIEAAKDEIEAAGSVSAFLEAAGIKSQVEAKVELKDGTYIMALFDVYATGTVYDKWVADGSIVATLKFPESQNVTKDSQIAVSHKLLEDGTWEVLPAVAGENTLEVTFGANMSPLALITNPAANPATGDDMIGLYIAIGVIVLASATLVVIFAKKRKAN